MVYNTMTVFRAKQRKLFYSISHTMDYLLSHSVGYTMPVSLTTAVFYNFTVSPVKAQLKFLLFMGSHPLERLAVWPRPKHMTWYTDCNSKSITVIARSRINVFRYMVLEEVFCCSYTLRPFKQRISMRLLVIIIIDIGHQTYNAIWSQTNGIR